MGTLRVVLDTNVLLSGIAYPASIPGKILSAWRHGAIEVLLSVCILDELRRVLPRLNHRHGLTTTEIDDLIDALSIQVEIVEPLTGIDPALRDAGDQAILGTLRAALQTAENADAEIDYLISGDKDLLALAESHPIVMPAQFWAKHGGL